tara:strand:+ start:1604 stop:2305 length:702 start_codon:yes stop_codon:yes gene_type:complete
MRKVALLLALFIVEISCAQTARVPELTVENFPIPVFTNSNLSLLILGSAWPKPIFAGDEIVVADSEGNFVGNSIVLNGHNGMALWGNDPLTLEKDGLITGEKFTIIHWSKNSNTYYSYKQFQIQTGSVTYIKDGFTIVTSMGEPEVYSRDNSVYYHIESVLSKTNVFSFYAKQKGVHSFKVYSSETVLFEVSDSIFDIGFHTFSDSLTLTPGDYTIDLFSEKSLISLKNFSVY